MNKVQIITAPGGDELVVLPRGDYEALVTRADEALEELADIEAYDLRMAALAQDANAFLPAEVSASMMQGHSLLKSLRLWRKMSPLELANKSGLAPALIDDLEARLARIEPGSAVQLARALDVEASWLAP